MIKIFSWNVNGIRAVVRKDVFAPFIEKFQPDILCLQETKAQQHQADVDLPDYTEYWNSANTAGYSGTAIFTKPKPVNVINGLADEITKKYDLIDNAKRNAAEEGRVITAEYLSFYLVTVYTPNAKDDLTRIPLRQQWDQAFLDHIVQLEKKKPVVFCGDLNVAHTPHDLARPKANEGKKGYTKEERSGFQAFIDAGFVDSFRLFHKGNGHYTWWTHWANARERNVGWRIDYILVSRRLKPKVHSAQIYPEIMGSDHCPVSIELDLKA